jgi:hypothetical protein
MAESAELRVTRCRETAAILRRQAGQIRSDNATVKLLLALADGWDQLASIEKEQLRSSRGQSPMFKSQDPIH